MNYCEETQPDDKQSTCLICHNDYNEESSEKSLIKIIDCSHIYHKVCIEEWFKYNKACPVCRKQLGVASEAPNLLQYILLFLSLQYPMHDENSSQSLSLSNVAFTCVFLNILLERYKKAADYNAIKIHIQELKLSLCVENEMLANDVNLSSRTAIIREIKHRQILMRCLLVQWLWSEADPYHMQEPPELPHGRALYSHPYLQNWRRKIETAMDAIIL